MKRILVILLCIVVLLVAFFYHNATETKEAAMPIIVTAENLSNAIRKAYLGG